MKKSSLFLIASIFLTTILVLGIVSAAAASTPADNSCSWLNKILGKCTPSTRGVEMKQTHANANSDKKPGLDKKDSTKSAIKTAKPEVKSKTSAKKAGTTSHPSKITGKVIDSKEKKGKKHSKK